jgi:hypothetical protein
MKTIAKTLVAISILLLSFQAYSAGNLNTVQSVHYKVNIHLAKIPHFDPKNVYVVMSDGKAPIAPPQLFRANTLTYEFSEKGTVTGTRVAQLIYNDGTSIGMFGSSVDVKTGRFIAGNTYEFDIYIYDQSAGKSGE